MVVHIHVQDPDLVDIMVGLDLEVIVQDIGTVAIKDKTKKNKQKMIINVN